MYTLYYKVSFSLFAPGLHTMAGILLKAWIFTFVIPVMQHIYVPICLSMLDKILNSQLVKMEIVLVHFDFVIKEN